MNRKNYLLPGFALLILLYNYLFWQQGLGINLAVFSTLLLVTAFIRFPKSIRSKYALITAAGTLISGAFVVIFNTTASLWAHFISFFVSIGFIHWPGIRSVFVAGMNSLYHYLLIPFRPFQLADRLGQTNAGMRRALRFTKLSLVPAIIFIVFYLIYLNANPIFQSYSGTFWASFGDWIFNFFQYFSFSRFLFLLLGAIIIAGLLLKDKIGLWIELDQPYKEQLQRIRMSRDRAYIRQQIRWDSRYSPFKILALKNENRTGVILLVMVNLLLALINAIDFNWLWLGRLQYGQGFSLKEYVHTGTELLILSVILSIGILLYYFRNNQNFYSSNKRLKQLAYLWIIQNAFLCISVALRNSHYIGFHGLAYKRIGVYIFLFLTVFGLITLFIKIRKKHSFYFLWNRNTWAVYTVLICLSLFNWDVLICRYNLHHENACGIDVDFYMGVSPSALPIVFQNLNVIRKQIDCHRNEDERWVRYLEFDDFARDLIVRRDVFERDYEGKGWQSWTYAESRAYKYLTGLQAADETRTKNGN